MSAAANDDRLMSLPCWQAVKALNGMPDAEVGMVLAAAVGVMSSRYGSMKTATVLSRVLAETNPPHLNGMSIAEIAFHVASKHGLSVRDLTASDDRPGARLKNVCLARQEAFAFAWRQRNARGNRKHSLKQIGRFFGGRDHTTVLHGVRAHERRMLEAGI